MNYYNEFNPEAAAWLRELIKQKLIADGEVDERSIIDVQASDIRGFTQHHFFAGIGGWSYALRLAGWADDKPVCTASLPCQPFSVAGAQKGIDDERHLLPHFIELVKQCNLQTIFGEQVPGAIKHGWLDDICTEMEREKYRVGQIVLTAAGEGAPHIRQRLYWVADRINKGSQGWLSWGQDQERETVSGHAGCGGTVDGMGNTKHDRQFTSAVSGSNEPSICSSEKGQDSTGELERTGSSRALPAGGICDTQSNKEHTGTTGGLHTQFSNERTVNDWSNPDWIYCKDGKYRAIEPSIKPLVNGIPKGMVRGGNISEAFDADNTQEARTMRLKGFGNAIVPQVASSFIQAFMAVQ
jgi:DNA (cytosine-5)-methyltransferase 1